MRARWAGGSFQAQTAFAALALLLGARGCEPSMHSRRIDTALVDLDLRTIAPSTLLPGTVLKARGQAFVDAPWGDSRIRIQGTFEPQSGEPRVVDVRLPAQYADGQRLESTLTPELFDRLGGGAGSLVGTATIEVQSAVNGRVYRSRAIDISLELTHTLAPALAVSAPSGIIFPNEPIDVAGTGLLFEGEGTTSARLEGCFAAADQETCDPIPTVLVPVVPTAADNRTQGRFAFGPRIAGIAPGQFRGSVTMVNEHANGETLTSAPQDCVWDLERPVIYGTGTNAASLGQYVTVYGGGFLGDDDGHTLLLLDGEFVPDRGDPIALQETLFAEFVDGEQVRYVINEDDNIGKKFDIRYGSGLFIGSLTPQIVFEDVEIEGEATSFELRLEPVKQVVYLNFLPAYTESLRLFGLRALDQRIRERVIEVVRRDFAGVNIDIRETPPEDFALYAQVDIAGPDPNGRGLLGYDNTPGKDVNNQRLYDRIGGVNALTQEDGWAGYGGVFIESLFGYSAAPPEHTMSLAPDPLFDALFDPFREDRGGHPILSADLNDVEIPVLDSGGSCPSEGDRRVQIACAVYALGSLIGTTVSHEMGHSLGLAKPYGGPLEFHNEGDELNRMMDADRPFAERAEIRGYGPSRFCVEEYMYLRQILPTDAPLDTTARPPC